MENPQQNSEEGLMPKSSPPQPNPAIVANEAGQGSGFPESDKSSATPVVVLSTLVAICGSFAYGCTVSSIPLSSPVITNNEVSNVSGLQESDSSATPAVIFSTLVAVCGSFAYGCAIGYSSPAESGMRADLRLSVTQYSVFGSVLTVGGIIGSLVNGKIADLVGRRRHAWSLYLGRFSLGIGLVLMAYVVSDVNNFVVAEFMCKASDSICIIVARQIPVYIAEITPKNIRGAFTAAFQFLLTSGLSVMYLVGTVVSWRALALIAAVPCLLQIIGLFFIPESPRWLAKVGREKELETTLQRLRGKNADISMESAHIREYTQTFEMDSKVGIFYLFQRKYAYPLVVGVGLSAMQPLLGATAIQYYASYIFSEADFSTKIGSISLAIIQLPVIGASVLLTDRFGRRPLLLASTIVMCLSLAIIATAFGLQGTHRWNEVTSVLVYVGIMGFSVGYSIGLSGLPDISHKHERFSRKPGDFHPPLHQLDHYIHIPFHDGMEQNSYKPVLAALAGTFSIFWVICAAGVAFVTFLVPETKGRTLEEIQASITKLSRR
ncbi:Sugar transporter ERD6-like 5 [Citrus sinensis]|uniref:Sugar transporter ERD6-like 5 n=1 Tax=Citrus sinensis TaxID=2711 RepID=A0ACB8KKB4_CITSI|nr:Sugar transporter ERD6-like 5 [Citrus sinensis]